MSSLTPRIDILNAANNLIINGNFDFWHRGVGPVTSSNTSVYLADRFRLSTSSGFSVNYSRTTSVPTLSQSGFASSYALRVDNNTAVASPGSGAAVSIFHFLEGHDFAAIHGKKVRLQFWARSSLTGTYGISLHNSAANRSYVTTFTINSANTWEKKYKDIQLDTAGAWLLDSGRGLVLVITLVAGPDWMTPTLDTWQSGNFRAATTQTNWASSSSGRYFEIAQVSLVPGDFDANVDIPFRRVGRNISDEHVMCRRYFHDITVTTAGSVVVAHSGMWTSSTTWQIPLVLPVRLRANPSLSHSGSWSVVNASGSPISATISGIIDFDNGGQSVTIHGTASSGVIGDATRLQSNVLGSYIWLDAEL